MKTLAALKAERDRLLRDMQKLHDDASREATEGKRQRSALTTDERTKYDELKVELEGVKRDIVDVEALQAEIAASEGAQRSAGDPIKPQPAGAGGKIESVKRADEDKPFASLGEQLQAIQRSSIHGGARDERLDVVNRAATGLNEKVDAEGGFLVQKDHADNILQLVQKTGLLPGLCQNVPISAGSNGIRFSVIDESSRATGSRLGGVQAYWVDEAEAATKSKPKLKKISADLNKLAALYYATEEVLADAPALQGFATNAMVAEFGFMLDDGIIRGTGAGEMQGVNGSAALIVVSKEGGQAADTVVAKNVIKMRQRMWAMGRSNYIWVANQELEEQLMTMAVAVGTGGQLVYMPAGGLTDQPHDRLFGRPVVYLEQCSAIGDQGDIMALDLSQYLLIKKGGIESASSIHVKFVEHEQCFRFTLRVNGMPLWSSALTPYKGNNTTSPFVTLEAR